MTGILFVFAFLAILILGSWVWVLSGELLDLRQRLDAQFKLLTKLDNREARDYLEICRSLSWIPGRRK